MLQIFANREAFAISVLLHHFRSSVFCEKTGTFLNNFAAPSWCSRALLCAGAVLKFLFPFESLPKVPFAAPACLNLDNLRRLSGRAMSRTRASGGLFRAVLGIIGRSAAEWRACIGFCSVKCMHLVPNLTKKAIRCGVASVYFFSTVKLVSFYYFWGLRHQKWTFRCRVASVHLFLLSKMHAFGVEPDQKCHSVVEGRACLFFPTVKLVSFYYFWGRWHQKWTFCCRGACVHHFFLRKTHAFLPSWASNRDSAAEWRASFFFALVKLQCFVLISAVLGGKMCVFVNLAGNGQNLPPGGSSGAHIRAKLGNH